MWKLLTLALVVLTPAVAEATPHEVEQCGLRLQLAVGAPISIAQVRMIVYESVDQSKEFRRMLLAVVAVESAFQSGAESSQGALGLTQTMAIARREVDRRWSGQPPAAALHQDVYYGSAYLALCRMDYGLNWAQALACYNGGPRQARLMQRGRRMCTETANYVARVWKLYEEHCR